MNFEVIINSERIQGIQDNVQICSTLISELMAIFEVSNCKQLPKKDIFVSLGSINKIHCPPPSSQFNQTVCSYVWVKCEPFLCA